MFELGFDFAMQEPQISIRLQLRLMSFFQSFLQKTLQHDFFNFLLFQIT